MIVATAGHVDHGKTSLVKALTGVDTDRLPDEKRRGLTIDLGFAYLPLADGPVIGFVDVPGHERFIHNMLCGVSGVDFVLLVVAADDGPMPQTIEHLAIVDQLGVRRGAVALTKVDRVAPERVADVTREVQALLAPTRLESAPIFPLSAVRGEGVDALKTSLERSARALEARDAQGNFRLAVDRCFSVAGAGLVVTGTAVSGTIAVGEPVRALLAGVEARVRAIHGQNTKTERGHAGQRCALNLAGAALGRTQIARGDWIVAGNVPPAVRRIDARLRVLAGEAKPFKHWTPVHLHLGAAHATGRVALLEDEVLAPGASGRVQLVLEQPIGALRGDRFIVRDQTARRTLGGGVVIDVFPPPRGRAKPERIAFLTAMELDDDGEALSTLLGEAASGLDLARFAENRNLSAAAAERLFERVAMKTVSGAAGRLGYAPARWSALRETALAALAAWHRRSPDLVGAPEDRLLEGSGIRMPRAALATLAAELAREGAVVREGLGVRLPQHRPQLSPADATLWQQLAPQLENSALRPPSIAELAVALGQEPKPLESALARLARQGFVVRISKTRFFLPAMLGRLEQFAVEEAQARGAITAAGFRDRSGIGRNLTIEVLEYFDRIRFTRRSGNSHVLVRSDHAINGRESHPGGAPGLQIR
jgi:selenocysteine-specific elongation factor